MTSSADALIGDLADYVVSYEVSSERALQTARWCLVDSLACAMQALNYPECTKLLGPVVPGASLEGGARIPGTGDELDPVTAAFNIGTMIRWLDYNDTWLAAEWGHPSDNLGAILACADYVSRRPSPRPLRLTDVLLAMVKAHEIQGVIALDHAFNRVGLDHVLLVRVASAAVSAHLLGGSRDQIANAISHAWIDGAALRVYRQAPNAGSRKSWAAGDATSRGVRLALISLTGEMGYPAALSAEGWGFCDVLFGSKPIRLSQPLGTYVMENVLFKAYAAEYHAQTAAEAAVQLHPRVRDRLDEIERIDVRTHESAMRIISKEGPLRNPADRDHCIQYIIAVALIHGTVLAEQYEDAAAADPRIDALRAKTLVEEDVSYSRDYLDPKKRSVANSIEIQFKDGQTTGVIEVEYPLGHPRRRNEAESVLREKWIGSLRSKLSMNQCEAILKLADEGNPTVPEVVEFFLPTE